MPSCSPGRIVSGRAILELLLARGVLVAPFTPCPAICDRATALD
ncbi:hypothetical protein [Streptomyces sp. NPDC057740]